MARTSSQTLYYWQADVGMFDDPKIVDLNDEYGPMGECIFFRILDYIARTDGYFAQLNDALIVYLYRSVGSKWVKSKRIISEVIQFCGVCGLFDVNLLTQNVITSQGIQRRWLYAKKKDRARGFSTAKYWLLEKEPLHGRERSFEDNCDNNADNCSNNSDNCNNNSPYKKRQNNIPPISPKGGEGGDRAKFFSLYPKLKGMAKLNDSKVDYSMLIQRFAESEFLRTRYSARWVLDNYAEIIRGEFIEQADAEEQMRRRAEWYRVRRDRAEEVADYWQKKASGIPAYAELLKRKKSAEIAAAKAEAQEDRSTLESKSAEVQELKSKLISVLSENGIRAEDLEPQYHCKICNDTGYDENGRPCGCYEEK